MTIGRMPGLVLPCLLAAACGAAQAAGKATSASAPAPRGVAACPAIRVPAGESDLHGLLRKASESAGFTLHYRASARQVTDFQGVFTAAEFIGRLGREAGLVVQYRRVPGCPEDASIAQLWVLPTQYPAATTAPAAPLASAPAAVPSRPSLAQEAEALRRKQEDAENAIYVNQN